MSCASFLILAGMLASTPSPLAHGSGWMLGGNLLQVEGQRPATAPGPGSFNQTQGWVYVRAATLEQGQGTELGSQLGFEFELALGLMAHESNTSDHQFPLGFTVRPAMAIRAFTFNQPFDGMLVFHAGLELAAGGSNWWSNDARLAVVGGARVAMEAGPWSGELEYQLVPYLITGAPGDLAISSYVHRFLLTIALGRVGLTGHVSISDQRTQLLDGAPEATRAIGFGVGIQLRGERP